MATEPSSADDTRFDVELEFLSCLANPQYLGWLAQTGCFDDVRMISYLEYLLYWREPEYARFIVYPAGLLCLDMLQQEQFRRNLRDPGFVQLLETHIYAGWLGKVKHGVASQTDSTENSAISVSGKAN
ncbi:hypothetical protein PYCC9005_002897 [Savitreella phatthalungensis]